jgi:hypothetical protein
MRKSVLLIAAFLIVSIVKAQDKLFIHKGNVSLGVAVEETDSMYFSQDLTEMHFQIGPDTMPQHFSHPIAEIDSITYGPSRDTVYVIYENGGVRIINPFAYQGVSVEVSGQDVVINSENEIRDIYYNLSGTTSDG